MYFRNCFTNRNQSISYLSLQELQVRPLEVLDCFVYQWLGFRVITHFANSYLAHLKLLSPTPWQAPLY